MEDFDLTQFTQTVEIRQLEEHFNLDLLILVDCILGILSTTKKLAKVIESQQLPQDVVKNSMEKLYTGQNNTTESPELFEQLATILGFQVIRCEDSDKEQVQMMRNLIQAIRLQQTE